MPTIDKTNHFQIFVINPGSTSTKVALFDGRQQVFEQIFSHSSSQLQGISLWDQIEIRLPLIQHFLHEHSVTTLDAVVGRGGLIKPVKPGTYIVNETMIKDARKGLQGKHAANLGCVLAQNIAQSSNCPAYVVDPVSVDEFEAIARISGHPLIERRTLAHALNIRAAVVWISEKLSLPPTQQNYVIAHLGGGISVAAIKRGKIVDVNDAAGAGPFSPERSGSLPLQQFIDLCFSGEYTQQQMRKLVMGQGGLKAYLGTTDLPEIETRIRNKNKEAELIYKAMVYQIAKEIAAMATVNNGKINAILLTGGLANSKYLVRQLKSRISFLAPVFVLPGELEMQAMAAGALRVLTGKESPKIYK